MKLEEFETNDNRKLQNKVEEGKKKKPQCLVSRNIA